MLSMTTVSLQEVPLKCVYLRLLFAESTYEIWALSFTSSSSEACLLGPFPVIDCSVVMFHSVPLCHAYLM